MLAALDAGPGGAAGQGGEADPQAAPRARGQAHRVEIAAGEAGEGEGVRGVAGGEAELVGAVGPGPIGFLHEVDDRLVDDVVVAGLLHDQTLDARPPGGLAWRRHHGRQRHPDVRRVAQPVAGVAGAVGGSEQGVVVDGPVGDPLVEIVHREQGGTRRRAPGDGVLERVEAARENSPVSNLTFAGGALHYGSSSLYMRFHMNEMLEVVERIYKPMN